MRGWIFNFSGGANQDLQKPRYSGTLLFFVKINWTPARAPPPLHCCGVMTRASTPFDTERALLLSKFQTLLSLSLLSVQFVSRYFFKREKKERAMVSSVEVVYLRL